MATLNPGSIWASAPELVQAYTSRGGEWLLPLVMGAVEQLPKQKYNLLYRGDNKIRHQTGLRSWTKSACQAEKFGKHLFVSFGEGVDIAAFSQFSEEEEVLHACSIHKKWIWLIGENTSVFLPKERQKYIPQILLHLNLEGDNLHMEEISVLREDLIPLREDLSLSGDCPGGIEIDLNQEVKKKKKSRPNSSCQLWREELNSVLGEWVSPRAASSLQIWLHNGVITQEGKGYVYINLDVDIEAYKLWGRLQGKGWKLRGFTLVPFSKGQKIPKSDGTKLISIPIRQE